MDGLQLVFPLIPCRMYLPLTLPFIFPFSLPLSVLHLLTVTKFRLSKKTTKKKQNNCGAGQRMLLAFSTFSLRISKEPLEERTVVRSFKFEFWDSQQMMLCTFFLFCNFLKILFLENFKRPPFRAHLITEGFHKETTFFFKAMLLYVLCLRIYTLKNGSYSSI